MHKKIILTGFLTFVILVSGTVAGQDRFPVLKGPYLGQEPPGKTGREIFLEKHLDRVREGLKKSEDANTEEIRPVGPDPVLHHRAFFPLRPGQIERQDKKPDQCGRNFNQKDREFTHLFSRKMAFPRSGG